MSPDNPESIYRSLNPEDLDPKEPYRHRPWRRWLVPRGWSRKKSFWVMTGLLISSFVFWFIPGVYRLRTGPVTVTRYTRKQGEIKATLGPQLKGWTSTKKVSRYALYAIVSAEDGKFYEHEGLDFGEIMNSVRTNMQKKRYARGGSTITQQVVKMAFLGREKTLLRKTREAVGALLLEKILTKDQILEWYINLAEFGDNVYGIGTGAWHYFRTKPELLSIEQSVHLALVLPSPNGWSRGLRQRSLTPFGQRRFATILNRMRQSGYVTKPQWMAAITRGDFGRPISGYASLIAAEEQDKLLCPGNPGCPESDDEDTLDLSMDELMDDLSFPKTTVPAGSTAGSPSEGTSEKVETTKKETLVPRSSPLVGPEGSSKDHSPQEGASPPVPQDAPKGETGNSITPTPASSPQSGEDLPQLRGPSDISEF